MVASVAQKPNWNRYLTLKAHYPRALALYSFFLSPGCALRKYTLLILYCVQSRSMLLWNPCWRPISHPCLECASSQSLEASTCPPLSLWLSMSLTNKWWRETVKMSLGVSTARQLCHFNGLRLRVLLKMDVSNYILSVLARLRGSFKSSTHEPDKQQSRECCNPFAAIL